MPRGRPKGSVNKARGGKKAPSVKVVEKFLIKQLEKDDIDKVEKSFTRKWGKENLPVFYKALEKVIDADDSWEDTDVDDMLADLDLDSFAYGSDDDTWY